jgi:hypothetical protein
MYADAGAGDISLWASTVNLLGGSYNDNGVFIANTPGVPTTNPVGGGVLYVQGGALRYRGSSGTVTNLAPA